jgi:hypothetical protein
VTSISWLTPCATPFRTKCPPFVPVSQKAYLLIVSPSASFAVNREEAAKLWPRDAVIFEAVTVGGVSTIATSSLVMMPTPTPLLMVAPLVAPVRLTLKLSLPSTLVSPLIVTETVFVVSPALKWSAVVGTLT